MGKNLSDAFLQKAREGSLQEEAENWLRIGRVSWKLRDDDNLLLAGAIVERRGGMLVHSSIIAREMNIPAVNGVPKATSLIQTGDYITVNGDLGIVVIGKPEFSIELGT